MDGFGWAALSGFLLVLVGLPWLLRRERRRLFLARLENGKSGA